MIEHAHEWNWDRKGGRNLCYKYNQQNHVINNVPALSIARLQLERKSANIMTTICILKQCNSFCNVNLFVLFIGFETMKY
jgi:hypothetical protein